MPLRSHHKPLVAPEIPRGFRKLCEPLQSWREDDPTLLPHCVDCKASIRIGQRYVIAFPLTVLCVPCSGLQVARPAR